MAAAQQAVAAAAALFWSVPLWALVLLAVVGDLVAIVALGRLGMFRAQCLLANVTVVVPANVFYYTAYYLLAPLRLLWCQLLNMVFTRLASEGTQKPSFWQASYGGFLDAVLVIYKMVIPGADVIDLPFETVYADMRTYVTTDPRWEKVAAACHKGLPAGVTNSLLFRLVFATVMQPLLSWWLVGPAYVPLLAPADGGGAPDVRQVIPQCRFLKKARAHYAATKGDSIYGDRACKNECKTSIELMVAYSLLQADWSVEPNLETGSCRFCMRAPGGKGGRGGDIEDLA